MDTVDASDSCRAKFVGSDADADGDSAMSLILEGVSGLGLC
jgi:hypothetical protein